MHNKPFFGRQFYAISPSTKHLIYLGIRDRIHGYPIQWIHVGFILINEFIYFVAVRKTGGDGKSGFSLSLSISL